MQSEVLMEADTAFKSGEGTRPVSPGKQRQQKKAEACNEVLKRLLESGNEAVDSPGFTEGIHAHFQRLPARYALDVNVERAEDVLTHKRLLELAQTHENSPVFHVRAVHIPVGLENSETAVLMNPSPKQEDILIAQGSFRPSVHPPPSFANLEALAIELSKPDDKKSSGGSHSLSKFPHMPMHEVTFSTSDKPKLLSQLSSLLADVGLNIREAHVFSTVDGYSLDVFVVDGWPTEVRVLQDRILMRSIGMLIHESTPFLKIPVRSTGMLIHAIPRVNTSFLKDIQDLQQALEAAIAGTEKRVWSRVSPVSSPTKSTPLRKTPDIEFLRIPSDGTDDWEIDHNQLKFSQKVASGSFGDLFRGSYCGQDVAIKVLKAERLNEDLQREFAQEVYIMRKVRHKNVVQFIGACTRPPNLCIVTEFMSGGSVYDYLHKHKGVFKLPALLRVAIDVSKGMDYLHQSNIIHRDLKAANLLMDEHEVIKVADFGVARVQAQSGVMTAETGTYRWMAPEVIEHRPYDRKADVFSFGIVLWELLTGKLPYDDLTPLQAAVGVVQKGLRPTLPNNIHPRLVQLLPRCWQQDPAERPEFSEITAILQDILNEVAEEEKKEKKGGVFFSGLKRTSH